MGRVTILRGSNLSLGTGSVLAALQTTAIGSSASLVKVKRCSVTQNASATLAMCRLEFATRDTAGTLTTTSSAPLSTEGGASGFTGNTSVIGGTGRSGINSSADSGGTYTTVLEEDFANTSGFLYKPDPTEQYLIVPSTVFVVRFSAAPGTTTGWSFHLWLEEN